MNTEKKETVRSHLLHLRDRKVLELRGVSDVISFDEETVELSTVCGALTVEGTGLHIQTLDLAEGIVTVEGIVSALSYSDAAEPEEKNGKPGWFGRLFR